MTPKVSVIVPVYNVESYLRKCLDSLVAQTLQEIEIIVVNDGSKDHSQDIIDEFQKKYPQKIWSYSKANGGLSDARNYGIDRASGDYIGFVDSDDYVGKEMFAEMYELAQKYVAEMVICNLQKVDQDGNITQKLTQIPNMPEKIELESGFSVFADMSYFACNKLFKKELFREKRFKKGVHFEDIQLIPQLLLQCTVIAQTQAYHYQYLERTDSITKTHTAKGLDILKAVEDVEKAFKQSQYQDKLKELKGFQILEGYYTFLAYLAFVKDKKVFSEMYSALEKFLQHRNISKKDLLTYKRFGRNYFLSLPIKKQIYYFLNVTDMFRLFKKI